MAWKDDRGKSIKKGVITWLVLVGCVLGLQVLDTQWRIPDGKGPSPGKSAVCQTWRHGPEYCSAGEAIQQGIMNIFLGVIVSLVAPVLVFASFAGGGVSGKEIGILIFLTPYIAIPLYTLMHHWLALLMKRWRHTPPSSQESK
jgi:hypothetical protein